MECYSYEVVAAEAEGALCGNNSLPLDAARLSLRYVSDVQYIIRPCHGRTARRARRSSIPQIDGPKHLAGGTPLECLQIYGSSPASRVRRSRV